MRPPLHLLLLVLAFCFLPVNLVSCQPTQEGKTLLSLTLADGGEVYLLEEAPRNDQEPMSETVAVWREDGQERERIINDPEFLSCDLLNL